MCLHFSARLEHLRKPISQHQKQVMPDRVRPKQVEILHGLQQADQRHVVERLDPGEPAAGPLIALLGLPNHSKNLRARAGQAALTGHRGVMGLERV
jgi:hypothetical protein